MRPNAGEDQLTRWKKCRIRHLRRDERVQRHAGRSSEMLVLHRMILVPELKLAFLSLLFEVDSCCPIQSSSIM